MGFINKGSRGIFDISTGELVAITNSHHEIHDGNHYYYKDWLDVDGDGTIVYFMFITPDTETEIHAKASLFGEAEFDIEIFRDATVSANGTPVTAFNNNQNSLNTPELQVFAAPTVTDPGTSIWRAKTGAGKDVGVQPGLSEEIIAKRNSKYLFKITKKVAGTHWIDVNFWWYEHICIK